MIFSGQIAGEGRHIKLKWMDIDLYFCHPLICCIFFVHSFLSQAVPMGMHFRILAQDCIGRSPTARVSEVHPGCPVRNKQEKEEEGVDEQ